MEKVVCCTALLLALYFVQESSCFPRSVSKSSSNLLKAKLQRKSILSQPLNVAHGNTAFKRQGNPPPPPPPPLPPMSVWDFIGITREDFIDDHKDNLTSEVRTSITEEMENIVTNIKRGMEEFARYLSCMVISMSQGTRSVDAGADLNAVKTDIVAEEEAEEKELDDLFKYLGLEDEEKVLDMVQSFPLPRYVKDCQKSPIIMDIGDEDFDDVQEFAVCSRLAALHTEKKMESNDGDTLSSFVDRLEDFIDGVFSLTRLYLDYDFDEGSETRRKLSDEKLREIKRVLEKYLSAPLYKK
ncbi:uncharacterized protein LOC133196501 [Saccostrea echinata]|uniref:uncharacterized protein LOC133196501 n=1 Tax=Saccostrea echinata TaxID=191078 RepID=UPI002A827455|nr:uncharacterized protein LOC133196501 [Saccostrea echinata]